MSNLPTNIRCAGVHAVGGAPLAICADCRRQGDGNKRDGQVFYIRPSAHYVASQVEGIPGRFECPNKIEPEPQA